jgi:enterochelin esterase-like enzyme
VTFRTIEISDTALSPDNLRFVTVKSPALGRRADITLFVPPQGTRTARPLPLLILLHGVYGSHWAWAYSGAAHLTAAEMIASGEIPPVAIAMPSDGLWGDGSGYVRHLTGEDYERWIMDDVPAACEQAATENIAPDLITPASPLFLAGLSMGGYGALRLGAKYASRVRGISAHSTCTHLRDLEKFIEEPMTSIGAFDNPDYDPMHWMRTNAAALPRIRFDCGTEDDLLPHNRALHQQMLDAGIAHEYHEFPGAHTWLYWREHLRDTLRFFGRSCKG